MKFTILSLTFFCCLSAWAQTIEIDKPYEISGKAKRGKLIDLDYDEDTKNFAVTYSLKASGRNFRFDTYNFTLDFDYKDMQTEEGKTPKVKKTKKKKGASRSNFKGDTYEEFYMDLYQPEENKSLLGAVFSGAYKKPRKVEKIRKIYTYDSEDDNYSIKYETVSSLEMKDSKGNVLYTIIGADESLYDVSDTTYNEATDEEVVKQKYIFFGDNRKGEYVMVFMSPGGNTNAEITIDKEVVIPAPNNMELQRAKALKNKTFFMLYRAKMLSKKEKAAGATPLKPTDFLALQFDEKGNEIRRINFESPSAYWNVSNLRWSASADGNKSGEITLWGYANNKKNTKFFATNPKPNGFQMACLHTTGLKYAGFTDFKQIGAVTKGAAKDGKKGSTLTAFHQFSSETSRGDNYFISTQMVKADKKTNAQVYSDLGVIQTNNKGEIEAFYSLKQKERNQFAQSTPMTQDLVWGNDNKSLYWLFLELDNVKEKNGRVDINMYARIGKIDTEAKTLGAMHIPGGTDYFLDMEYPYWTDGAGKFCFFGANKSGKKIWFSRVAF